MLALDYFGAISLPGCGVGSACGAASRSVWGNVAGIPLTFVGLAHFAAIGTLLLLSRSRLPGILVVGLMLAAGCSLVYAGIALGANLICGYCMAVHAANVSMASCCVAGWFVTRSRADSGMVGWRGPVIVAALVGLSVYIVLIPLDSRFKKAQRELAEAQLAQSQEAMRQEAAGSGGAEQGNAGMPSSANDVARGATPASRAESGSQVTPGSQTTPGTQPLAQKPNDAPSPANLARLLTGRYRIGPAQATVRIIMFTDYQCPDCFTIEQELTSLMKTRPEISVGIRYFPLSSKCNPAMNGQDMHPNACWAARAAEAAGMLKGPEGFWEMHRALFARGGSFTDAELPPLLRSLGYEPGQFQQVMMGAETLARVKEDVDAAISMGIYFTPMIFINGVELRGWQAPNALTRTVTALLASNPAHSAGEADIAPDARAKYIADWQAQPVLTVPQSARRHELGPQDAQTDVVLFGDMTEKNTVDADGILRLFTTGPKPNIRYTFAHFPVNSSCNPSTTLNNNPHACRVARASEVVAAMAGPEAFWEFHNYIMSHQAELVGQPVDVTLSEAIVAAGLSAPDVLSSLEEPFVSEAIAADAAVAKQLGIRGIPMILINGRLVPRWKLNNENMLAAMVLEQAGPEPDPAADQPSADEPR